MPTLPQAPLLGALTLALLWSALFSAIDAARQQVLNPLQPGAAPEPAALPAQALILCSFAGKALVIALGCLLGLQWASLDNLQQGFWLGSGSAAVALLIVAEFLPRRLAKRHPQALLNLGTSLRWPLRLVQPLACGLDAIARLLLRPFRPAPAAVAVDAEQDEHFDDEAPDETARAGLAHGLHALHRITVSDLLIPRNEVDGIDLDDPLEQIIDQLMVSRHTRLPVWHGDINQVEAVLDTRRISHLLPTRALTHETLRAACHEPYFIPEGTPLPLQLLNFHKQQRRLGLVVDEYGEVLGLVTLENLLEEIVGEFEDDEHLHNPHVHPQPDGRFVIDGAASLRDLNRSLGWHLPCEGGPKTLNGLVTEALENIPASAVCLKMGRYRMEILTTEDNCASKVLMWVASQRG